MKHGPMNDDHLSRREWRRAWREMTVFALIVAVTALVAVFWPGDADATTQDTRGEYLRKVLPYYDREVPSWCYEDMACWTGSVHDNRSNKELVQSLPIHY